MKCNIRESLDESQVVKSLAERFALLTDQRKKRGVRYALAPMLVMLVLAKLCGTDNPMEIARWVEYRAKWLKEVLGLCWKRMPHHATWRRNLASALNLTELEEVACEYLSLLDKEDSELLNLDGKRLRGTIPKGETNGLHLLALQKAEKNLVVNQTALREGENEITASKRLLKEANLQGKIVTGDAIFAQRELSKQVIKAGGDYLWKVKQNQGNLYEQLKEFFRKASVSQDVEKAKSLDKGHGRIEERILWSSSRFADGLDWPFVSQVFAIKREVIDCKTQKLSCKMTFGITSLSPMDADAESLLNLTRKHWSIENGLHLRRDVTLKEDRCRMKSRTAAEALAVCNNLVLGLIRATGWNNVAEARRFYSAHKRDALRLVLQPIT